MLTVRSNDVLSRFQCGFIKLVLAKTHLAIIACGCVQKVNIQNGGLFQIYVYLRLLLESDKTCEKGFSLSSSPVKSVRAGTCVCVHVYIRNEVR